MSIFLVASWASCLLVSCWCESDVKLIHTSLSQPLLFCHCHVSCGVLLVRPPDVITHSKFVTFLIKPAPKLTHGAWGWRVSWIYWICGILHWHYPAPLILSLVFLIGSFILYNSFMNILFLHWEPLKMQHKMFCNLVDSSFLSFY